MCTDINMNTYTLNDMYPTFLEAQRREMEKHRWIESEKANRDLGVEAYFDWIRRYAKNYRKEYFEKHNITINKDQHIQ